MATVERRDYDRTQSRISPFLAFISASTCQLFAVGVTVHLTYLTVSKELARIGVFRELRSVDNAYAVFIAACSNNIRQGVGYLALAPDN